MKKNQFGSKPRAASKRIGSPTKINLKAPGKKGASPKKNQITVGKLIDQFAPFKDVEMPTQSLHDKKQMRKAQMTKRVQKLKQIKIEINEPAQAKIKSILQSKPLKQPKRAKKSDDTELRKQVSISAEPSKGVAKREHFKQNGRNHSQESNGPLKLPNHAVGNNQTSDFTMSSVGYNDQDQDFASKNSIISEVDSAFEDVTPAAEKKVTRTEIKIQKQKQRGQGDLQANARNANNLSMSLATNNFESSENIKKTIGRQKTYGNKNQGLKPQSNIQRCPTQKSKGGSGDEDQQFKLKVADADNFRSRVDRFKKGTAADGRQSRNSSLNFTIDNQLDNLSINFGKNKFVKKSKLSQQDRSEDIGSVASVITKGLVNQEQILAKSIPKLDEDFSPKMRRKSPKTRHIQSPPNINSASKSNIEVKWANFPEDIMQKNQRMINVYLQTPYKVLTINQIKNQKSENKLFRAENNLNLHTVLRTNYVEKSNDKNKQELADEATQILMNNLMSMTTKNSYKKQRSNVRNFSKTRSSLQKEMSQTHLSDSKNVIDMESDNASLRDNLKIHFKQKFYRQLNNKLEKKIDQVHQQSNFIKKQSNLFNIYGSNKQGQLFNASISQSQLQPGTVTGSYFLKEQSQQQERGTSPTDDDDEALNLLESNGDRTELLLNLVAVSQNMGYSKMEIRELQRKEKMLLRAEETLDILHNKIRDKLTQGSSQSAAGGFKTSRKDLRNVDKKINTYSHKTSKKSQSQAFRENSPKLPKVNQNSIENNNGEVKDYFDNKINLRRSIEQKLHYDISKVQSYSTTKNKQEIKTSLLKSPLKKKPTQKESSVEKNSRHHKKIRTEIVLPEILSKPQMILEQSREFISKPGSKIKMTTKDPEEFFPLKKSGTTTEKQTKEKLEPIRSIRKEKGALMNKMRTGGKSDIINNSTTNVIMAYAGHQKQLSYQFMNRSPKQVRQKDIENNENPDRKVVNMQILKGVLSQQRKLNRIITSGVKPNKTDQFLVMSPPKQQVALPRIQVSPLETKIASPGQ